jgi:hypothetical protein
LSLAQVKGWNWDSLVCTGLYSDGLDSRGSIPGRGKVFFSIEFRPALKSTQPPRSLPPGESYPGVKLTAHLHLVSM